MKQLILTILLTLFFSINCIAQYGWFKNSSNPISSGLVDIDFVNTKTGFVADRNCNIFKTSDAGKTWKNIYNVPKDFVGMSFVNDKVGYFIDSYFCTTTNKIIIYKTTNGGVNWDKLEYPYTDYPFAFTSIYFRTALHGCISGGVILTNKDNGNIATTHDGGNTWKVCNLGETFKFYEAFFIDENTGWIPCISGLIFKTTDGGDSWKIVYNPPKGGAILFVYFIDHNIGFAGGSRGKLYITSDGGANWTEGYIGKDVTINQIKFANSKLGWAATSGGILVTKDGGKSWNYQSIEEDAASFEKLDVIDNNNSWVINSNNVYSTSSAGEIITKIDAQILINGQPIICDGDSIRLDAEPIRAGYKYYWSTGDTTFRIFAKSSGKYTLIIKSNEGITDSTSIELSVRPKPPITFIANSDFCTGTAVNISIAEKYPSMLWSTGDNTQKITVNKPGKYTITVRDNNGCSNSQDFFLYEKGLTVLTKDLNDIIFDSTAIDSFNEKSFVYNNNNNYDIRITSCSVKYDTSLYVIQTDKKLPLTINPGADFKFTIKFKPYEDRKFFDTLIIKSDLPCKSEKRVQIKGIGKIDTIPSDINESFDYITISPNPVLDNIFISGLSNYDIIVIYAQEGQLMYSGEYKNILDVSNYPKGLYFVKIRNKIFKFLKI